MKQNTILKIILMIMTLTILTSSVLGQNTFFNNINNQIYGTTRTGNIAIGENQVLNTALTVRQNGNTSSDGVIIRNVDGSNIRIWKDTNVGHISVGTGNEVSLRNGNTGLGTNNPVWKLHVSFLAGDFPVLRLEDSDGLCDLNPEAGSLSTVCSSDERIKYDIQEVQESYIDIYRNLPIKQYKVKASDDFMIGTIAQEYALYHPDRVIAYDNDGKEYYSVAQNSQWEDAQAIKEVILELDKLKETKQTYLQGLGDTENYFNFDNYVNIPIESTENNIVVIGSDQLKNKTNYYISLTALKGFCGDYYVELENANTRGDVAIVTEKPCKFQFKIEYN